MTYPLRTVVFEKIKQYGNITDHDLINSLAKDNIPTIEDDLNKILLDLEISIKICLKFQNKLNT